MSRIRKLIIMMMLTIGIVGATSQLCYALEDTGNSTWNNFINDSRFTDGVSWPYNKEPVLRSYQAWGCCAYCCDYVKYCYNINDPRNGAVFYDANEIRPGDVLTVGNPYDGNGHWFICFKRNGNSLYVAEGNGPNDRVRIGWNYTVSGVANDPKGFTAGYHFADPEPIMAPMDVNFTVDGRDTEKLTGIGTIQVYVDGQLQTTEGATSYVDFCQHVPVGKSYEVRVNITNSNYRFIGVDTSESGYSGQTGTTSSSMTKVRLVFWKMAPMDVNFTVDGEETSKLTGIGNIQVYVDGELQKTLDATSYVDFCQHVFVGKPYEVKVNVTNSDYRFIGVDTSASGYSGQTGTTGESNTFVRLVFCKMAPMDVNFTVNGEETSKLTGIGNIQVYVDGELQKTLDATSYVDFCQHVFVGKPYEVKLNLTNPNYRFIGVDTSETGYTGQTGTTGKNGTKVRLLLETVQNSGGGNQTRGGSQSGGNSQSGTGSQTGGNNQQGNGSKPGSGSKPSSGSNPTSGSKPISQTTKTAPVEVKEPITISKTPVSVKAKAKKNKVTVSWKKIKKNKKTKALLAQIKGTEVQYSADPSFPSATSVKVPLGKKKTKLVLKGLQKKMAYYIRVRYTDGAGGYSNWSVVKRVVAK